MAKAEKKKRLCPECKGPARGQGFIHTAKCSKFKGKATDSRRARTSADGDGFDIKQFRGLDVETLVDYRDKLDNLIQAKADELKERISKLQTIADSIEKK